MKKYQLFVDCDLDGVVSYLTFCWFHPKDEISAVTTTVTNFREAYTKWLARHNPADFDRVFILDLDVGEHKDLIDTSKHFIIDHHKTHVDSGPYKEAIAIVKEYTSACKLAYKVFTKTTNIEISKPRKHLILLADDYDCYAHKLIDSKRLNILYWNTQNRFNMFCKDFDKGFKGFNLMQKNIIKQYIVKLASIKKDLEIYKMNKDGLKILSTTATTAINDIADYLLDELGADVAIIVNTNSNRISFRRNKNCDTINLIDFVHEVCGDGGGHAYASGGSITGKFMDFSKGLIPYNE